MKKYIWPLKNKIEPVVVRDITGINIAMKLIS